MIDLDTWPGDRVDGRPCCWLPAYIQRNMREAGLEEWASDLKGYGIPYQGLPRILQGYSKNGWRVVDTGDALALVRGLYEQKNERGCRAALACDQDRIVRDMEAWRPWVEMMQHD